ncbi:MAG TPA: hypothetical protein PLP03_06745 [Bacteroidales bacterium]|jgi:hypothetical protein|nr:hypothetical protein [Bacteroidales bacterium]HPY67842.1 hypothetical protein [Bacteroidales bacterium]
MRNNKILQQFNAVFGIFMVIFYLGMGVFLLFFAQKIFNIDKALRSILGGTFLLYGTYRIFVTIRQISDAFSSNKDEE